MAHWNQLKVVAWLWGVAFMCITAVNAQEPASILIEPKFSVGDKVTFRTTKTRANTFNGNPATTPAVSWNNTLEVVEKVESGFICTWTRGEIVFEAKQKMPPIVESLANMWSDVRVDLIVSPDGQIVDIRNYDELAGKVELTVEKTRELLQTQGTDPSAADAAIAGVKKMMANRAIGTQLLVKDIAGLFGCYGREIDLSGGTMYELELPNPFGNVPLPATETWEEPIWSDDHKVATLNWTQSIDRDAMARVISDMLDTLAPDKVADRERLMKEMQTFKMHTTGSYKYNPKSGKIIYAYFERLIESGNQGRLEAWEWTVTQ